MSDISLTIQNIKKRKDFLYLSDNGVSAVTPAFVVKCALPVRKFHPGECSVPCESGVRVGYVVRKKIGNAVTRNFVRRRLREMVRKYLAVNGTAGYDYVIIARSYSVNRDFGKMKKEFVSALEQLADKTRESPIGKETTAEQ